MAKSNNTNLFIGLAVAAVVLGGGGLWLYTNANSAKADAAASVAPTLPSGRLATLGGGVKDVRFLALDSVRPGDDGVVHASVLTIGKSAAGLEGGAAMIVEAKGFNCTRQRVLDGTVGAFDFEGKLVSTKILAAGRGRPYAGADEQAQADAACGKPPSGKVFASVAAAQRHVQMPPEHYAHLVETRPTDANAWAWLCSAAARGQWRSQAPADCDTAVKLNPDAVDVQLDRAFLNLMIGRQPTAAAGFRKILERDPQNTVALFANGLLAEMAGDKATSKRDRGLALKADPQVALWIETRYGFRISPEFRS